MWGIQTIHFNIKYSLLFFVSSIYSPFLPAMWLQIYMYSISLCSSYFKTLFNFTEWWNYLSINMERWLVIKHIHICILYLFYIGSCINHLVVHLKDFITRYPSPKSWYSSSSTPLQLFVCHTYFGLCLHGELRCVYIMIRGISI